MRYCRFDETNTNLLEEREISTLAELADVLDKPSWNVWLEGLGSPNCINEEVQWRTLTKFIREQVME